MIDSTNTYVKMMDTILKQVKPFKFLGIIVNEKLTWETHKQHVFNKVCRTLGILFKCRNVMTEKETIKMYKTFIQPYFLYAIEVWGHSIQSEQDILTKLQSKVLRIVFNCKRSHDAWRHNNRQISSIKELYFNVVKKLCMKHHSSLLPCNLIKSVLPEFNVTQLQSRITRISLEQMYNSKNTSSSTDCIFQN